MIVEEIPQDSKPFNMLFDGEWQEAKEIEGEGTMRWFWGEAIGAVPMDEIQDWKPIDENGESLNHLFGDPIGELNDLTPIRSKN